MRINGITIMLNAMLIGAVFFSAEAGTSRHLTQDAKQTGEIQSVTVELTEEGYKPDSFKLVQGVPARVTFTRKAEATCGTEVVIPEYDIKRELPLNKPVTVEFTPNKTGEFAFACGMNMLRGKIIVVEKEQRLSNRN